MCQGTLYSGKLSSEKTFASFAIFLSHPQKFCQRNFEGGGIFAGPAIFFSVEFIEKCSLSPSKVSG